MTSSTSTSRIILRDYSNYREYLRDYLERQRSQGIKLTNRRFAELLGIASSSWLTMLLQGKKGLSPETALAVSRLLGHDAWEQEFFDALVRFNQAKKLDERNHWFARMTALRKQKGHTSSVVVSDAQYEFYSHWYYTAVRSLLGMHPLGDDYDTIARMVSPHITPRQARKAIKVLKKLDMIRLDERTGVYALTQTAISTGKHELSLAIQNFQRETMRLGIEAIDRYRPGVRDISALSVGVSAATADAIKAEIAALRRRIIDLANADAQADRVVQINFQLFPLSDPAHIPSPAPEQAEKRSDGGDESMAPPKPQRKRRS